MRHLLTTLEGDRPRYRRAPVRMIQSEPLLGVDDTFQAMVAGSLGLGGWLSDVSSYTSSVISSAKNSNIPGLTQVASGVRSAGEAISQIGSNIQTGSQTQVVQVPSPYAVQAKDNTLLYVALAAGVGLLIVAGRK